MSTATRKPIDFTQIIVEKGVRAGLYVPTGLDRFQLASAKLQAYESLEKKMMARFDDLKRYGFVVENEVPEVKRIKEIVEIRVLEENMEGDCHELSSCDSGAVNITGSCGMPCA